MQNITAPGQLRAKRRKPGVLLGRLALYIAVVGVALAAVAERGGRPGVRDDRQGEAVGRRLGDFFF